MENRAGTYQINLSGETEYKSFVPNALPPNPAIEIRNDLLKQLIRANNAVVTLESISKRIPNMELFISMYVRKEALMSSQIEGTQATLEDIFDIKIPKNTNQDVEDVINYIKATNYAIKRLAALPLCNRLIKETHAILMRGVRGQEKSPGKFRSSQNWVGGRGSSLKTAIYIPPNTDDMRQAMSDLEKYINSDDQLDELIKAALIHYQFETIHPFLDGNGRIGRLLIILFLMEKKRLTTPALYISYYLKLNRVEYYDRMSEVRKKGDYEQWINFFLKAVEESAQDAVRTINKLTDLQNKNIELIEAMGRTAKNTKHVFHFLEKNPIIEIGQTAKLLGLSFNTVASAVDRLVKAGILVQREEAGRNRTFIYKEYLDILRSGT